jgi:integrase/recombinase XerD
MKRWDGLLERYLEVCVSRGLSPATVESRRGELEKLGCWLKRKRPRRNLEEVDGQTLIEYVKARTAFHAKATVSRVTSHLRCLGEFLVEEGVWAENPMRWVRGPRLDPRGKMPRRIGAGHLEKLWEAAAEIRTQYHRHLSVTILSLLYGTGLRRGELERLNVEDWDAQEQLVRIDGQKTGCQRLVPVSAAVARCLEIYLPYRHNLLERWGQKKERALLLNRRGDRLRGESLSVLVHRLAKRARVPLVTLHQFRHTCASDLLENGASLPEVQQLLGHKTVVTTNRYLQIADPERAKAMRQHPVNDFLSQLATLEARTT